MWGDGTPWKTKAAFYSYLRGGLRKVWMRHPCKISKITSCRFQVDRYDKNGKIMLDKKGNPRKIWNCKCEICSHQGVMSDFHVDHIIAAGSLMGYENLLDFTYRLLYVTEKDLRVICKECNYILAYADKNGVTFEEAKAEKTAISLVGSNKDKEWLKDRGISPESSKQKRRKQIVEFLLKK